MGSTVSRTYDLNESRYNCVRGVVSSVFVSSVFVSSVFVSSMFVTISIDSSEIPSLLNSVPSSLKLSFDDIP